jgi:NAD-dependent DNA ligase
MAKAKTKAKKKPAAKKTTAKPAAKKELPTPKARASTKLSVNGKTVVLTGTVTGMERKDAEDKLASLGARCTSSVSKKTDYVFAMADAGSKKAEAERLGIPVLSETVLFSLIGSPGKPKALPKPISADAKEKVEERRPDQTEGFSGKTVVITGTLSQGRAEIASMLEAVGAKVAGSVSANTHYLITGAGVGASKLSKATALGVTIIDEPTMTQMLEG